LKARKKIGGVVLCRQRPKEQEGKTLKANSLIRKMRNKTNKEWVGVTDIKARAKKKKKISGTKKKNPHDKLS